MEAQQNNSRRPHQPLTHTIKHNVDPSTFTFALTVVIGIFFAFAATYGQAQDQSTTQQAQEDKQLAAQNQYRTALFTAISAAEVKHSEMAAFANRQLHQATYCLMLVNPRPMQAIAQLTQQVVLTSQAKDQLATFEIIKNHFDLESVRANHPCIEQSYPGDRILASR